MILKKKESGITLIALVISIIVLLILVGVTIVALSGDNGILTRAKEAKEKKEQAQEDESKTLSNMENILESYKFENINQADTNPAGAMPSDATILENNANKGIVIKDKNENEWVWVEVPKTTVFAGLTIDTTKELTEQNYNDIKNKLVTYATTYRKGSATQNENWTDEWYAKDGEVLVTESTANLTDVQKKLTNGCGLTYNEYKIEYQKMLKSVYTYGGFWIGRYEAGIEGSIEDVSKARIAHTDIKIGKSPKAISQKDALPYNYVYCSEAESLAREMKPNSNYISGLMFGIQWDLVCKFLEVKSGFKISDINSNSSNWGNYNNTEKAITSVKAKQSTDNGMNWKSITGVKPANSSTILSSGASEETNKMNIYDLAGNEWEWTLEKTLDSKYPCSNRGGSYNLEGVGYPVANRSNIGIADSSQNLSFRATFYADYK